MEQRTKITKAMSLHPLILISIMGILLIVAQILFVLNFEIPGARYDSPIHIAIISIYLLFWIYTFLFIRSASKDLEKESDRYMDSQRNLTSTFLGIKYMPRTTVFDAFCNEADLPIINIGDNLDLVPSSIEMGGLESIIMKRPGRESILAGLLQSIKNLYDIILIDCPSQNWISMLNSFVASTSVLIPICCDSYAAEGLIQVTQMVELASYSFNPILAVDGIVLTRYNGRRTLDVAIEQELKSHYGSLVMNTRIRANSKLVQAALLGQDIFTYDPDCNGAIDYANLLEEIKLKLEKI